MTDLTEIDGVGPSYAEDLQEAGFESAEDVASADVDQLDAVLERADGATLHENALDEVGDEDEDDVTDDTLSFAPGLSPVQQHHLLRALVEQEVRYRRVNNLDGVDRVQDAIETVRGEEPFDLTHQQLGDAYTGVNQLEEAYRSERNINSLVSDIASMKQEIQSVRRRHN